MRFNLGDYFYLKCRNKMDHDILRKIMEVFSQENTRLKGEITELRKQLNSASAKNDDAIIAEVFAEKKKSRKKPVAVESHPVVSQPEVVPEMPKKGRPRTITDKSAYQRAYQAEYRAKKKAEKALQSGGEVVHSA
jgi:cell division septum initiation protein DivIVA